VHFVHTIAYWTKASKITRCRCATSDSRAKPVILAYCFLLEVINDE